jgi:Cft2 family RNA processing exonuclease
LNYHIIGSSSKGNSVRVEDILFDCGLPYKKIKEDLYSVRHLFLTHIHSDHINPTTLKRIRKEFPRIKVYGNYQVMKKFNGLVDEMVMPETTIQLETASITPFENVHDVVCYGYTFKMNNQNMLYTTDTCSLENIPTDEPFDYFFLESNYNAEKINGLDREKAFIEYGYDVLGGAFRHLSTQACHEFYFSNRREKDSKLIELHKSERFY